MADDHHGKPQARDCGLPSEDLLRGLKRKNLITLLALLTFVAGARRASWRNRPGRRGSKHEGSQKISVVWLALAILLPYLTGTLLGVISTGMAIP